MIRTIEYKENTGSGTCSVNESGDDNDHVRAEW